MLKQMARLRVGLVLFLGIVMFGSIASASGVIYKGDNRRDSREERNYYRDGRWYKHDSMGHEVVVVDLPAGARIESLPPQHATVVVQGASYYHDDRYYYRPEPNGGYVVVTPPTEVRSQPQDNQDNRGDRGDNGRNEQNRDRNR